MHQYEMNRLWLMALTVVVLALFLNTCEQRQEINKLQSTIAPTVERSPNDLEFYFDEQLVSEPLEYGVIMRPNSGLFEAVLTLHEMPPEHRALEFDAEIGSIEWLSLFEANDFTPGHNLTCYELTSQSTIKIEELSFD